MGAVVGLMLIWYLFAAGKEEKKQAGVLEF